MGEKTLVDSQIADAIAFVRQLDAGGIPPTLAVWYFYDDAAEWRLLLAGPFFDGLLPKQEQVAYRRIVDTMSYLTLSSLTLSDIKLVRSDSPPSLAIRSLIRTNADAVGTMHFANTTLNGIFISAMTVLRSAS